MARRVRWGRLIPAILVLLALIAGAVFGISALIRALSVTEEAAAVEIGILPSATFLPCGDGVIAWDGIKLARFSPAGIELWSQEIAMPGAILAVSETYAALYTESELRLYTSGGVYLSSKMNFKPSISEVRPGNKLIALLSEEDDPLVRVVDGDMANVYSKIETGASIIDFGLTPNDLLWTLTLDVNGTAATTTAGLFQPMKQSNVGQAVFTDELIYRVVPMKTKLWMIGTSNLYAYDIANMTAKPDSTMIYGWQNLRGFAPYEADILGFARADALEKGSYTSLWMLPAESSETYLPVSALATTTDGKVLLMLTRESLHVQRVKEGTTERKTLVFPVERVLCTIPGKGFVYASGGRAYLLIPPAI